MGKRDGGGGLWPLSVLQGVLTLLICALICHLFHFETLESPLFIAGVSSSV